MARTTTNELHNNVRIWLPGPFTYVYSTCPDINNSNDSQDSIYRSVIMTAITRIHLVHDECKTTQSGCQSYTKSTNIGLESAVLSIQYYCEADIHIHTW